MAAPVVYRDVAPGAHISGQLFAGKKFWVAQRVPARQRYLDLIRSNGGEVVILEKRADYLIANHLHGGCPPGSIAYTFVDACIDEGRIQDPEKHRAGPPEGPARAPGSISRPVKGTRTPYTPEDDKLLYKWVYDFKQQGRLVSGNEIYKQLEQQNPRHTWQSWRDRYLKTLQHRPPSAYGIDEDAPPPPAREPRAETAVGRKIPAREHINSAEYTVDDLTADGLFEKDDWEQVYAYAAEINEWQGEEYRNRWEQVAEGQRQTAGQWRQYFEKVVWPQWLQDSDEKHQVIKSRVLKRLQERDAQEEEIAQNQDEPDPGPSTPTSRTANLKRKRTGVDDDSFESFLKEQRKGKIPSAYVLFTRERKWDLWNHQRPELDYAGLHKVLMSQWDALSAEEKAPYYAQEAAESPQAMPSSSTAVNETPKYISEAYEKALQQLREDPGATETSRVTQDEGPPSAKRTRSVPPHLGTERDPVEVSSAATESQPLTQDELPEEGSARPIRVGEDSEPDGLEAFSPLPDDRVSNSPTPRVERHHNAFFSSSSQGSPLPARSTQPADTSVDDGSEKLISEASTTESLQEFSQIVNGDSHNPSYPSLPQSQASSPPQSPGSTVSSAGSGDPDPPLAPDEVDEYFEEQQADGYPQHFIAAALKHTRWRPNLATEVLQAWRASLPLPKKRGIWSDSDDEEVEGGDGFALAKLERKHTQDGWGGVTERMNFLSMYRSAKAQE